MILVFRRLRGVPRAANEALLAAVNRSREVFLVHTELGGSYTIRLALGAVMVQVRGGEAFIFYMHVYGSYRMTSGMCLQLKRRRWSCPEKRTGGVD